MRNILAEHNRRFLGAEIREWIAFHLENNTSHYKMASRMKKYLDTIYDDREYLIVLNHKDHARGGYRRRCSPMLLLCGKTDGWW